MDETGDVPVNEKKSLIKDAFLIKGNNRTQRTEEDARSSYKEAVGSHPFVDRAHYNAIIDSDAVFKDANGAVVSIFIKNALPAQITNKASDVLRIAPSRTSLRANIFGGEAPLSGIAGYYDYAGSPVELKCRKTSFTSEHVNNWHNILQLTHFVSEIYKTSIPIQWGCQNAAIPDVVRLGDSPFSTLTVNQRFRTAKHTDSGDFDDGFGCLTVLEGVYEGLHIGQPDFGVCYRMEPGDLLLFNTHHYHCNTELELPYKYNSDWSRLSCVFYYRALLGESNCMNEFRRRLKEAMELGLDTNGFEEIASTNNGENYCRPAPVFCGPQSPFRIAHSLTQLNSYSCVKGNDVYSVLQLLHNFVTAIPSNYIDVFGEKSIDCGGLPPRTSSEVQSMFNLTKSGSVKTSDLGGFSDGSITKDLVEMKKGCLSISSLKDALPDALFALYKENRNNWLNFVSHDWKKALERNAFQTNFTWQNHGDVSRSFFDLCDVAQEIMIYLFGNDNPSKSEDASFWFCFASSMHDATIVELDMPSTAISMKKLNVKLRDYYFRGTRYFSDQSPEEQQRRLLRSKRIAAVRKSAINNDDQETLNWLANDTFNYQSENKSVDYKKEELRMLTSVLQRAELAAKHVERAQNTVGTCDDSKTPDNAENVTTTIRLLCVVPDAEHTYEQDIVDLVEGLHCLTIGEERNGLINTEVSRFVNSDTMQLWALIALQREPTNNKVTLEEMVYFLKERVSSAGKSSFVGSESHKVEYSFPNVPVNTSNNYDDSKISVKNMDKNISNIKGTVKLTIVTMELSEALKHQSRNECSYDIVIMNHIISTDPGVASKPDGPLLTKEMSMNISRLSSLSVYNIILINESDLSDPASSLILPTIDTVQQITVSGCLSLAYAMKEATFNCNKQELKKSKTNQENGTHATSPALSSLLFPAQCRIRATPKNIMRGIDLRNSICRMTPLTVAATCPFKRSLCQTICYICVPKAT